MKTSDGVIKSLTGQYGLRFSEHFDLMIPGHSRDSLETYRNTLIQRGIAAGEIPNETFFGHHLFCVKDPDNHGITIYTSHEIA